MVLLQLGIKCNSDIFEMLKNSSGHVICSLLFLFWNVGVPIGPLCRNAGLLGHSEDCQCIATFQSHYAILSVIVNFKKCD